MHKIINKQLGRLRKIDKIILAKLEDAFANDFTDEQACFYAGIHPATLYRYQQRNKNFCERKMALKARPLMLAKETVIKSLSDPNYAWRYLERKDPEFKPVIKTEHSGSIALGVVTTEDLSSEEKEAMQKLREARRKRIEEKSDKMQ